MGDEASKGECGMSACEGCGREGYYPGEYAVCVGCVGARRRAAMTRRCACGKLRRETGVKQQGPRRFISCERCLGYVRGL